VRCVSQPIPSIQKYTSKPRPPETNATSKIAVVVRRAKRWVCACSIIQRVTKSANARISIQTFNALSGLSKMSSIPSYVKMEPAGSMPWVKSAPAKKRVSRNIGTRRPPNHRSRGRQRDVRLSHTDISSPSHARTKRFDVKPKMISSREIVVEINDMSDLFTECQSIEEGARVAAVRHSTDEVTTYSARSSPWQRPASGGRSEP